MHRPLLWDEGTTLFDFVLKPLWVPLASYPEPNNHVLFSALSWLSVALFGPHLCQPTLVFEQGPSRVFLVPLNPRDPAELASCRVRRPDP